MSSIDMRVLGGLPVTIEYDIQPAEKDVGLYSDYVDDWYVTHINGKRCKKSPEWLHTRIEKTKGEEDRIISECMDHAAEAYYDYRNDC